MLLENLVQLKHVEPIHNESMCYRLEEATGALTETSILHPHGKLDESEGINFVAVSSFSWPLRKFLRQSDGRGSSALFG